MVCSTSSGWTTELFKPRVRLNTSFHKPSLFEFGKWYQWQDLGFFSTAIPKICGIFVWESFGFLGFDEQRSNLAILPVWVLFLGFGLCFWFPWLGFGLCFWFPPWFLTRFAFLIIIQLTITACPLITGLCPNSWDILGMKWEGLWGSGFRSLLQRLQNLGRGSDWSEPYEFLYSIYLYHPISVNWSDINRSPIMKFISILIPFIIRTNLIDWRVLVPMDSQISISWYPVATDAKRCFQ